MLDISSIDCLDVSDPHIASQIRDVLAVNSDQNCMIDMGDSGGNGRILGILVMSLSYNSSGSRVSRVSRSKSLLSLLSSVDFATSG